MIPDSRKTLWLRWIFANALGEMVGLGLTFAVGAVVISNLEDQGSLLIVMASFLVAAASGVIEASLVGLAQWWAMHPWFPTITRRSWWLATLVGALIAYLCGYLPSTIISLGEHASQGVAPAAEPPQWLVWLLAAGLGLVGGATLSFAQWLVLRKKVPGASVWIPANMLAWLVGMPLIFWGIDTAQSKGGLFLLVTVIAGVLFITGLVVGSIHGSFLIRLAHNQQSTTFTTGSIISPS